MDFMYARKGTMIEVSDSGQRRFPNSNADNIQE